MNELAIDQASHLADSSRGAIQLLGTTESGGYTWLRISLDTHGIQSDPSGIGLRDREVFKIGVTNTFPFVPPTIWTEHRRWAGTAHVQWGRHLCVYAAPSIEWDPADGMRGLIARLSLWLTRAAAGTLDPDGQPLHPPVAYPDDDAGHLVVHADLGTLTPWAAPSPTTTATVYAWCVQEGDRVDVVDWLSYGDSLERVLAPNFSPLDPDGRRFFLAPCVLIDQQIGFEYPATAAALAISLETAGVSEEGLLEAIARSGMVNSHLGRLAEPVSSFPNLVLLGTPSRRLKGSGPLAHISGWRLDEFGTQIGELLAETEFGSLEHVKPKVMDLAGRWLSFAKTAWMTIHEDRAEVTLRRDLESPLAAYFQKRVLVLGCGAIGAPIAEHLVRSGVAALTVADKGSVGPGILVRQPYFDGDIGVPKARALSERLSRIRRDLNVDFYAGNVIGKYLTDESPVPDFDLIIDATADAGVRAALELRRSKDRFTWPDQVTAIIGHTADLGLMAVSPRGTSGGGVDVLRRTSLYARANSSWDDVASDFFPETPRTDLFFPEPGCSAPTFVGSSAQVGALASILLTALSESIFKTSESASEMVAIIARPFAGGRVGLDRARWPSDFVSSDVGGSGFEVRISQDAISEIRAETRRGLRLRGAGIETGGMLLGSFDDAIKVAFVDVATGPPADSVLSALYFDHGTQGTQDLLEHYLASSSNVTGFAGMWHTHPVGRAHPSPTDEIGMARILNFAGTGRRALMLILGGPKPKWDEFCDGTGLADVYARVVTDSDALYISVSRSGSSFGSDEYPGGYGYRPRATSQVRRQGNRRGTR